MTDEGHGDGDQQPTTADEIKASVGTADTGQLERWAQDSRVTVAHAARAELDHRRDQPNTGRPPAHEVSQQLYRQAYGEGDTPVVYNDDPDVLAAPQTHGAAPVAATAEGVTGGVDDDEDGGAA